MSENVICASLDKLCQPTSTLRVELIGNASLPLWQLDIIALGYQLGALVLPAATPIVVWVLFYRDFIARFTPVFA